MAIRDATPRRFRTDGLLWRHAFSRVLYGSNFVQEVTAGTYPLIEQAIELRHEQR